MRMLNDSCLWARRVAFAMCAAFAVTAAAASQWDLTAGDYHSHLIKSDKSFELHLHDKATHGIVDTSKSKVTATLLVGGVREEIPMRQKQAGILVGDRALEGDWTLLFRVEVPGRKLAQLRYSAKMPTSGAAAKHDNAEHDHEHGKSTKK